MTVRTIATIAALPAAALVQANALAADGDWEFSRTMDEFTGEDRAVAITSVYGGTPKTSHLLVRCEGERLDVYMSFDYLNLVGTSVTVHGKHVRLNYLFDGGAVRGKDTFNFFGGGLGLFVDEKQSAVRFARQFITRNEFKVRLPYYRVGNVVVAFSLKGAAEHVRKVLAACDVPEREDLRNVLTEADRVMWGCMVAKDSLSGASSGRRGQGAVAVSEVQRIVETSCKDTDTATAYCETGRKVIRLEREREKREVVTIWEEMVQRFCAKV